MRDEWNLDVRHEALLNEACEVLANIYDLRVILARDGMIITDRFGQPRAHPAAKELRPLQTTFAGLLKAMGLKADLDEPVLTPVTARPSVVRELSRADACDPGWRDPDRY